jgi:hypothetical protein
MRRTKILVTVALISLVGVAGVVIASRIKPEPALNYPSLKELPCGSWMGAPVGNCVTRKPDVPRFNETQTGNNLQQNDVLRSQVDDIQKRLDLLETKQAVDAVTPK